MQKIIIYLIFKSFINDFKFYISVQFNLTLIMIR